MGAARPLGSVTLMFGLVALPTRIFTAHAPEKIEFNQLVKETGARVGVVKVDKSTEKALPEPQADHIVLGYEYEPEKFVTFSAEEIKALEAQANPDVIRIKEVVPAATLDTRFLTGKTQYLGPGKGSDRAYALIRTLLEQRQGVAIGQRGGARRDELVVIGVHDGGLVMHEALYADEVRARYESFTLIEFVHAPEELELAGRLFDDLAMPGFAPARLVNKGKDRVLAAVETKKANGQIVLPAPASDVAGAPLQLLEQLKLSVVKRGGVRKAAKAAPPSQVASQVVPKARRGRAAAAG